jgi:ketosteroid isomerase-like protein
MTKESTTPDVVELVRRYVAALNRRDQDAAMGFFAPNGVLEATGMDTTFEDVAAIRGFAEDWSRSYSEQGFEAQEILDLGHGIALSVNEQRGRLSGKSPRDPPPGRVGLRVGG